MLTAEVTRDSWFDIRNAAAFDRRPPTAEPDEWSQFLFKYKLGEQLQFRDHPIQLDVELNGGCNMSCPFCIHGYETIENRLMPVETYHALVDEAVELGVRSIKLNYINEPLMRRDLEDLIAYAHDHGILNSYFVTNGVLLKPARRSRILDGPLTKLFVSIDATTAETYNRQRLSGSFDRVVANVEAFIRERNEQGREFPLVLVSFLRNQINKHEAEAFAEKWTDLADLVSFQKMNEVPDRDTGLTIDYADPDMGCKFPFKQVLVDHLGNVQPCCKLSGKKLQLGNVREMTLAQAWKAMEPLREMHGANAWHDHEVCANCMRCS